MDKKNKYKIIGKVYEEVVEVEIKGFDIFRNTEQTFMKAIIDTADKITTEKLAELGFKKQEWISVNDRLPECLKSDIAFEDGISKNVWIYLHGVQTTAKYFGKTDQWIIPGYTGNWRPSHWMPAPDDPRRDDNE